MISTDTRTLEDILSESLINEIVTAVGLPVTDFTHGLVWRLFRKVTDRLAHLGANFDQLIAEEGLPAASHWALQFFCADIQAQGVEHIPPQGPLLVATNHPGTYDAFSVFSLLKSHDIRCITTVIPFFNLLPNARERFLFAPRDDSTQRMVAMRKAIRHLRNGGTLVYFPSGHRDPDPFTYPDGVQSFERWMDVFDIFFRSVRDLKVMPTVVSGVVSRQWARHPVTWLRKEQIDRQRLAEFGQVITQILKPGSLLMTPCISFGEAVSELELRMKIGDGNLRRAVIERAKALFHHSARHYGDFAD